MLNGQGPFRAMCYGQIRSQCIDTGDFSARPVSDTLFATKVGWECAFRELMSSGRC
jgi:hypothetical protein